MIKKVFGGLLFTLCGVVSVWAQAATNEVESVQVQGVLKQGGAVYGTVNPGDKVRVNGEGVPVGPQGRFVYGIDRYAPMELILTVQRARGQTHSQTLLVEPRTYPTQYVKGVQQKHVTPPAEETARIEQETQQILAARNTFSPSFFLAQGFRWPLENRPTTGVYGSRRFYNGEERSWHKGVDLAAPTGTPVFAPAPGTVVLALPNSFFNGNLLVVDHGHQIFTIYAHLNKMLVKAGDTLATGQTIAEVGTTGRSTGPHLHWGLYWRNMALDPALFITE